MTSNIGSYVKPKALESISIEDDDDIFGNEDDDFDSQGYLYEVPYTSSSADRSSIGSIPWADDAIKINKIEWEKVEKMLSGLEPLSTTEDDLKKEILDWQKKFPQIMNENQHSKNLKLDSLDIDSLYSIDLTSEDEECETKDKVPLSREYITNSKPVKKSFEKDSNLCQLMYNFTLKSVPYKLNQREGNRGIINERKCANSTCSYSLCTPQHLIEQVPLISTSNNRFPMPPILNTVLDSRKKFKNLVQNKNPSFVQLTHIQQAKSAALAQEQKPCSRFHTGHRSAWHVPIAVNRFSNNANSIMLPSISSRQQINQRYSARPANTSTSSNVGTSKIGTSSSGSRINPIRTNNRLSQTLSNKNHLVLDSSTNASTQTSTSNTPTSTRSISAVVQYPRLTSFNALYLPYSASKFHTFK